MAMLSPPASPSPTPDGYEFGYPTLQRVYGAPTRRFLYDSLESLHTMRQSIGSPVSAYASAAAHLKKAHHEFDKRRWKEGAGILLKSLAHNSHDARAVQGFRGAIEHVQRDREFFDPGFRRKDRDWGSGPPIRPKEKPPEKAKPKRTIVDDFDEQWRLARMGEVLKSRGAKSTSGISGEEELAQLRELMHREFYIAMRTIFRYYARLDGAKVKTIAVRSRKLDNDDMYTMSKHEFDAFAVDCRLVEGGGRSARAGAASNRGGAVSSRGGFLTGPKVNLIFIMANKELGREEEAAALASDANTKLTMVLPEFMQAVVRLAEAKYVKQGRTLAERFQLLMEKDVLSNARWDDVEEFRRMMKKGEVRAAIEEARGTLQRLFDKYCGLDMHAARVYGSARNASVSIREFVAMLGELGLLDNALSQKDAQDAFATAQADPVIDDDVTTANDAKKGNLEELNREEFEEAMVRCAVQRHFQLQALMTGGTTQRNPLATHRTLAHHREAKTARQREGVSRRSSRGSESDRSDAEAGPESMRRVQSEATLPPVRAPAPHPASSPALASSPAGGASPADGPSRRISIVVESIVAPPPASASAASSRSSDNEEDKPDDVSPDEIADAIQVFFEAVEKAMNAKKNGTPVPVADVPKGMSASKSSPAIPTFTKVAAAPRSMTPTLPGVPGRAPGMPSPTSGKRPASPGGSLGLPAAPGAPRLTMVVDGGRAPESAPPAAAAATAPAERRSSVGPVGQRRASLTVPSVW